MSDSVEQAAYALGTESIHIFSVSYVHNLPTSVTVSSATTTLVDPNGGTTNPTPSVSTPDVAVSVGPLATVGQYQLRIIATYSDGQKAVKIIEFDVV